MSSPEFTQFIEPSPFQKRELRRLAEEVTANHPCSRRCFEGTLWDGRKFETVTPKLEPNDDVYVFSFIEDSRASDDQYGFSIVTSYTLEPNDRMQKAIYGELDPNLARPVDQPDPVPDLGEAWLRIGESVDCHRQDEAIGLNSVSAEEAQEVIDTLTYFQSADSV